MPELTQKLLREYFSYDAETGHLLWQVERTKRGGRTKAGDRAGYLAPDGYRAINICGRPHKEHRLIWLWVHGQLPEHDLDHVNRVRDDNRLANLRSATRSQNIANSVSRTASGLKGAYRNKSYGRWFSHIAIDGRLTKLGYFDTAEEAHAAYVVAARQRYGEFARTD